MPTNRPRINVVLDSATYGAVKHLAAMNGHSLSEQAFDMLRQQAELFEDIGSAAIAEDRVKRGGRAISHRELKRRLGLK